MGKSDGTPKGSALGSASVGGRLDSGARRSSLVYAIKEELPAAQMPEECIAGIEVGLPCYSLDLYSTSR